MAEAPSSAICIALLGAESTGKTTLAAALAQRLSFSTGRRVAWVAEALREWCEHIGRTPLAHEQASILRAQHERIDAAAATHDIVICDTTGVMTAVYSALLFNDRSLHERAVALHRRMALTLLLATDLPWVADGLQRDGPHVRGPVDAALRELLLRERLPFAVITGMGDVRVERALAAVQPLLTQAQREGGLFSRLDPQHTAASSRWACACCDVPEYEQRLTKAPWAGLRPALPPKGSE